MIPFGQRLQEQLDALQPSRNQAWLAEESGVSTSVISRIISGTRNSTPAVIESLAPVLGMDAAQLVLGTDAEARYRSSGELVKKEIYEAAARQVADDQVRIADLERQLNDLPNVVAKLGQTHHDLDRARRDLEDLRAENKQLRTELQRYRSGLTQAVAEFAALQGQLKTLADELATTKKSSRASAILGAVDAFSGVITVAHFLTRDEPASDETPKERARKGKSK